MPLITSAGTRTLTAYLFCHEACFFITLICLLLVQPNGGLGLIDIASLSSSATLWICIPIVVVLITLFHTSEWLSFSLWPVLTPAWAAGSKLLNVEGMSVDRMLGRRGWKVWGCAFAVTSFGMNYVYTYNPMFFALVHVAPVLTPW